MTHRRSREDDRDIESELDNEEEPAPFPIAPDNPLNKTDSSDLRETDENDETTTPKKAADKNWSRVRSGVMNAIKKTPNETQKFLGIDAPVDNTGHVMPSTSNKNTKTLNNWQERTFRVLNSNMIFGGKLKESELEKYMNNLDENNLNEADPFLYYVSSGGKQYKMPPNLSVLGLALNGLANMVSKSPQKPSNEEQLRDMKLDEDLEEPALRAGLLKAGTTDIDNPDGRRMVRSDSLDFDEEELNVEGPCDAFTHAFTGKRVPGVGFFDRLFDNFIDKNKYQEILDNVKYNRPYFTYWLSFVQILICLISIFAYGLAPIGFSYEQHKGLVIATNLEKQLISYPVKQNFWIGPAFMDLVHLGAKYAPCMRNDSNIYKAILFDQEKEKETACCVRNDRGGCVQSSQEECSDLLSVWHKWNSGLPELVSNRTSGTVCGLNPNYCNDLNSTNWPDDISKWPICKNPTRPADTIVKDEHMHCELIGRPCCIGIQGECMITTKEHCTLMRGYFHDYANLCSQVDCMQDVCGMIDFLDPKSPDQVYRLFTSIFIHSGIIQLITTLFFNMFILRDVEKIAGCLRVAIVYIASGIIGNLGSAIFLPYQAEVGPSGSQFGIFACTFVEMFHSWKKYVNPWLAFLKLFACLLIFFLIGFLPMIDNYANIFGFISGLLIGSILFPDIGKGKRTDEENRNGRCRRYIVISVCISIIIVMFAALIVFFYIKPIDKCDACRLFSCPFGPKYCLDMDFNVTRVKN